MRSKNFIARAFYYKTPAQKGRGPLPKPEGVSKADFAANFFPMPMRLTFDPTLSSEAVRIILAVGSLTWNGSRAMMSLAEVAASTGLPVKAIRRAMRELRTRGLVEISHVPGMKPVLSLPLDQFQIGKQSEKPECECRRGVPVTASGRCHMCLNEERDEELLVLAHAALGASAPEHLVAGWIKQYESAQKALPRVRRAKRRVEVKRAQEASWIGHDEVKSA